VRYSGMAAWDGEIPDEKVWQVVTFLSRLRNLPPDVEADWHQPPVEKRVLPQDPLANGPSN
jgi:hypothetical protein